MTSGPAGRAPGPRLRLHVLRIAGGCEPSPFVWRVRMALAHKGLEAERIGIGYGEKHLLSFSGQGLVPVLSHGARWVADSWTIAQHLEDEFPDRPSLFGGAAGRALSLFVTRWADSEQLASLRFLLWPPTWDLVPEVDKAYFRDDRERKAGMTMAQMRADPEGRIAAFRRVMEPVRQTVRRQPFLCGETPGWADYAVLGGFLWARSVARFRLLEPDDPLHRWRADLLGAFGGLAAASGFEEEPAGFARAAGG